MRYAWIGLAMAALASQSAVAQIERYDVNSGKYVTSDPFAQPTPDTPNPYRLNPRTSNNIIPQAGPNPPRPNAGAAGAPAATAGTASPSQLVPMAGMTMYGNDAGPADPFTKPDWWPQ